VFDNCIDYDDAIEALENSPVCFPAFVTIAGTKCGEAAIVELTPNGNRVHKTTRNGKPIAIGNDYLSGDLREALDNTSATINPSDKGPREEQRRNRLLASLNRRRPRSVASAIRAI
jgi:hypothetical protein